MELDFTRFNALFTSEIAEEQRRCKGYKEITEQDREWAKKHAKKWKKERKQVFDGFIPKEKCTRCGGTSFLYFEIKDSRGNKLIRALCTGCGASDSAKLEKNKNKRSQNAQLGWRYKALERAGCKCQICGSTKDLNVHHIIPVCVCRNVKPEYMWNDGNAAVVCKECHDLIHYCDDWSKASS